MSSEKSFTGTKLQIVAKIAEWLEDQESNYYLELLVRRLDES